MNQNFLQKIILMGMVVITFVMTTACNKSININEESYFKSFRRQSLYDNNLVSNYSLIDYKERALGFDGLVFNFDDEGKFLPLIWEDTTYDSFGIPAYVGDGRMHNDGKQEAVTNIAAVLSATLLEIDKSNQDGKDYVKALDAFFSKDEGIILNNPSGSSKTTSLWYLLYPAILYTQVAQLYPDQLEMQENVLTNIESWYKAYEVMNNNGEADFAYTGFDFTINEPYKNGIWTEPDSAVGIGLLMYYGYEITGDEKYLDAAIDCMDYIETIFGSPQYEVLMYYAPYLAAKLNALHGTDYDIEKSLNRVFDGNSLPRGGWGSIVGTWGDYEVDGLFGSTTDGGGYAFAMNTFAAAGAITPTVQYDSRYAASIGEWMLHLTNNARYFFSDQVEPEKQSCTYIDVCQEINEDIKLYVPYEGIRKASNGQIPWFGGDPTVYGWAQTDFSLYSGAHIGILGSMIEETDVEQILKINLQSTQFYDQHEYSTFMMYNPYDETKEVTYKVSSNEKIDLFNTVTNEIIATNVVGSTKVSINKDEALVLVEIPTDSRLEFINKQIKVNDVNVSYEKTTVSVLNFKDNDTISGKTSFNIGFVSNSLNDDIKEIEVIIDGKSLKFNNLDDVKINTKDFVNGVKKINITVQTRNGLVDETSIRLKIKN